jgi:hypothetical protein
MSADWKNSICNTPSSVNFGIPLDYVGINGENSSPIDLFYSQQQKILAFCTPSFMTNNSSLSPLMLVGLVSNVESYFRGIFAHSIRLCPLARKNSSSKAMNLSSIYFGYDFLELSAFENQSLSDSQMIIKNIRVLFDIDINKNTSSISPPLMEYQKLCELRHSIVHCNGIINSKNAIELDLPPNRNHYQVDISFSELQNSALICTSLVRACNIEFFEKMITRWAIQWRLLPEYDSNNNLKKIKKIWNTFISEFDLQNNNISNPSTLLKTKNKIEKEFNL